MRVLGVDPGSVSAAWALLLSDGRAVCGDVPVVNKMVDGRNFHRLMQTQAPDFAVVERVSAMPKQGVSSSFRFGQGLGLIQGVIYASGVALVEVAPGTWKRHFKLGADKEAARALALKRFPHVDNLDRKRDAGRAEALLIALWFEEQGL